MDTETLLTVREAAVKIGVSESAIRNATLQGRLPFVVKFGRKLIEQEALAAYQRRTQPGGIKATGRPPKAAETAAAPEANLSASGLAASDLAASDLAASEQDQ